VKLLQVTLWGQPPLRTQILLFRDTLSGTAKLKHTDLSKNAKGDLKLAKIAQNVKSIELLLKITKDLTIYRIGWF